MKRENVRFKSVVTPKLELDIKNLLKSKGFVFDRSQSSNHFIIVQDEILYCATLSEFLANDNPYKEFKEICELIKTIEEPQPPFKFQTFDKVLVRDSTVHNWMPRFFDEIHNEYFRDINGHQWNMMMQYEGNESYKNSMKEPKQWWVMEDQKPRLIRKEQN